MREEILIQVYSSLYDHIRTKLILLFVRTSRGIERIVVHTTIWLNQILTLYKIAFC